MLDRDQIDKATARRIGVIVAGIALNVVLAFLSDHFNMPLYCDTIGTIVVSALGGLLPGILTAVVTNVLCSFFNSHAIYFTIINILIAVTTVRFTGNGRTVNKKKIPLLILIFALYGGIPGTAFQWLLFGGPQFKDVYDVSEFLSVHTHIPFFICSTVVNTGLNIVDKGLATGASILILKYLPAGLSNELKNSGWKQKPLADDKIKALKRMKYGKHSLNRRLTLMLLLASVMIAFVMAYSSISLYFGKMKDEYRENATKAARFARDVVNAEMIDEYIG
ncbi:MAG: hypothetical protein IKX95_00530, partial [Lachnospiraceae bacterium]|nr:hypothetical protein [Lachnospiraceae bacterium]